METESATNIYLDAESSSKCRGKTQTSFKDRKPTSQTIKKKIEKIFLQIPPKPLQKELKMLSKDTPKPSSGTP